jgi:DNA primase
MRQVLDLLSFEPSSVRDDQLRGKCPVHGSSSDQSGSFSVNLTKGRYYCFKCNSKGNHLELWAAVRRRSIYHAAVDLCAAIGREAPWIHRW